MEDKLMVFLLLFLQGTSTAGSRSSRRDWACGARWRGRGYSCTDEICRHPVAFNLLEAPPPGCIMRFRPWSW
ncbi:hypothetical protein V8F33_008028 [Rhypophila sp. PSN 637]